MSRLLRRRLRRRTVSPSRRSSRSRLPIWAAQPPPQVKPQASVSGSLYQPPEFPNGEETITLHLPATLPVIDLLDLVGKHLNMSYMYDPQKVTGDVTLKLNGGLDGQVKKKDLYLLLEAALQEKDLVMTRHKGNIVRVMPKADATKLDPELVTTEGAPIERGNIIVQQVFDSSTLTIPPPTT